MRSKKTLIIELGPKAIKICQLNSSGRKKTIEDLEVFEFSKELDLSQVDSVFSKFPKVKYERILFSFSRAFFLVRFLKLPSHDIEEARKMLPFQLAKIVPSSLKEVMYDFTLTEIDQEFSKLVVFLIQEKKAGAHLEFMAPSKIVPSRITLSSEGLYDWLVFQSNFLDIKRSSFRAVIDIDKYCADFVVVSEKGIIFSRTFFYSQDSELTAGVEQSLQIFNKEFGESKISKVIFTGNKKGDIFKGNNLGEAVFINYWEHFPIKKGLKEQSAGSDFSFASILGLSRNRSSFRLDFSPQSIKKQRECIGRKQKYLGALTIGVELILIGCLFLGKYIYDRHAYCEFLNRRTEKIRIEAKELDQAGHKLKILDEEFKKSPLFAKIIHQVISSVPPDTQLTLLDFKENGEFLLKGYTRGYSKVFEEMKIALDESDYFTEVEVRDASRVRHKDRMMVEFYIYGERKSTE